MHFATNWITQSVPDTEKESKDSFLRSLLTNMKIILTCIYILGPL